MPRKPKAPKTIATLKHKEAKRANIPTAEYQSVMQAEDKAPVKVHYPRGDKGLTEEKEARNRDLDPQLVWRGKDQQDWSDLVVNAPPLYIQEKVKPKVLIDDLLKESSRGEAQQSGGMADLFADFNGLPEGADKTDFYHYEGNWQNRMILGDSLQVMASLAEREGLRGKVQCIYLDPPYGIKFNSNFQWSTTSRDVKDGRSHPQRAEGHADLRQHQPRLRVRARAAHHAEVYRQQHRDRRHLGQVPADPGTAARTTQQGSRNTLAGVGNTTRYLRQNRRERWFPKSSFRDNTQ